MPKMCTSRSLSSFPSVFMLESQQFHFLIKTSRPTKWYTRDLRANCSQQHKSMQMDVLKSHLIRSFSCYIIFVDYFEHFRYASRIWISVFDGIRTVRNGTAVILYFNKIERIVYYARANVHEMRYRNSSWKLCNIWFDALILSHAN